MKSFCLAVAAAASWMAAPAAAENVKAQDPQSLVRAMQSAGFAADLGTDSTGDPMISSSVDGTKFKVLFYNCTGHKECATIQFVSGYDLDKALGFEKINEWNRTQRFGRAFLDSEGDPFVQMDVDLDDGGVSQLLFIDNLEFWTSLVGSFEKHIGYSD